MNLSTCEIRVLFKRLRSKFRARDDHHPLCSWRKDKPCDCYAAYGNEALDLIDEIQRRFDGEKPR